MTAGSNTKHVVMFSGGVGSWAAGKRVAEKYGTGNLVLLFADTNTEDEDLYRFLKDAHENIGGRLVILDNDGKSIWDVMKEQRFLANSRIDPCSKFLKRVPMRKWIETHCNPHNTVCHLGIDWSEEHRLFKAQKYWEPWKVEAPMCDEPYLTKDEVFAWLESEGIRRPRLYDMGFAHNNCGGGCVKAGQGQFKQLLEHRPEVFAEWERGEREMQELVGQDVTILREQRKGVKMRLPLSVLRERVEGNQPVDELDIGGCNCFFPDSDD